MRRFLVVRTVNGINVWVNADTIAVLKPTRADGDDDNYLHTLVILSHGERIESDESVSEIMANNGFASGATAPSGAFGSWYEEAP